MTEEESLDLGTCCRLRSLADRLLDARKREAFARDVRIQVEERIAELIPFNPDEQKQKTVDRVTVKRGYNYSADEDKCEQIRKAFEAKGWCSPAKPPPVKSKDVFVEQGYEWYRKNDKEVFAVLAEFVTVTPKKVSVTVKPPKQES